MKKIYETPVAIVTSFSSEEATNAVAVSSVTGLDKVQKVTGKNVINF